MFINDKNKNMKYLTLFFAVLLIALQGCQNNPKQSANEQETGAVAKNVDPQKTNEQKAVTGTVATATKNTEQQQNSLISQIEPTTQDEYNFITKGYKIQVESGLDMKKGYSLKDITEYSTNSNGSVRKVEFKALLRDGQTKPCAILCKYKRLDTGFNEYLCIPSYNAPIEIWEETFNSFKSLLSVKPVFPAVSSGTGNAELTVMDALSRLSSFYATRNQVEETTQDEYNFITKGYKIQVESGLDMKKGYSLKDITDYSTNSNGSIRTVEFKALFKDGQNKPCAILCKYKRLDTGANEYLCIPTYGTPIEIWEETFKSYESINSWSGNAELTIMNALSRLSSFYATK